jgi:sugar lactone lactonase YvrE
LIGWRRAVLTVVRQAHIREECGRAPGDGILRSFRPKKGGHGIRWVGPAAETKRMIIRLSLVLVALALLALSAGVPVRVGAQANPAIVVLDPAFSRIVPDGAQIEKLAGGFTFTEGPLWDPAGFLLFSDTQGGNRIMKWTPDGQVTTFRQPSHDSGGLTFDRQGRLIVCERRRISRTEKDGTVATMVERFNGRRLNSPNDLVVKSDGSIYFTDPSYGLSYPEQELPCEGVYRISPDGRLSLLIDDFQEPNGIALSPDESTLYVDDTSRAHIRAFDVRADGTLGNGRLFAPLKALGKGGADGMKVDVEGNVYCSAPGAIQVFDPHGKPLGTITLPEPPANLGWGDADGKGLFATARTSLYRIRLNIPGLRP